MTPSTLKSLLPSLDEVRIIVFKRWGVENAPPLLLSKEDVGTIMAISLGLGALFGENEEAERHWMNTRNPSLPAAPIAMVLDGRVDEVLSMVERMRGL